MEFYRYSTVKGELRPNIGLEVYNLHKETPKGYWIGFGSLGEGKLRSHSRWIPKVSKKRFAYPTKEEALQNYKQRCLSRTVILQGQLWEMEVVFKLIKKLEEQ